MNESQNWHLDYLVSKHNNYKDSQGYPIYLALQDYFSEEDGPEISDKEHAQVIKVFCNYVLDEAEKEGK